MRVALILPYFGTMPNYFPLWLKTAGHNPDFTFMIFTDCDMTGFNLPDNVQVHSMTLEKVRSLIAPHFDFDFILDRPYKLCDYKPIYGLIFQDWINGYDFWGYCDPDIIWGNLRNFLTDDELNNYDRLGNRGPLCLYRNTEKSLTFALNKMPGYLISYRDVYRSRTSMFFDESKLLVELFDKFVGGKQTRITGRAEVVAYRRQFTLGEIPMRAFRWDRGKLYGFCDDGEVKEFSYVHLQKRAMNFDRGLESNDSFLILPTKFTEDHELTQEEITDSMTPSSEYVAQWEKKHRQTTPSAKLARRFENFMNDTLTGKAATFKWLIDAKKHHGWLS